MYKYKNRTHIIGPHRTIFVAVQDENLVHMFPKKCRGKLTRNTNSDRSDYYAQIQPYWGDRFQRGQHPL